MQLALSILLLALSTILVSSQISPFATKKGDCPPTPKSSTCDMTCLFDMHCGGSQKCCPTSCGGTYCIKPVVQRAKPTIREKPGLCPEPRTLPWVCSSRCSSDKDCRADKKCCPSGCGGKGCYKPAMEVEIGPEENFSDDDVNREIYRDFFDRT